MGRQPVTSSGSGPSPAKGSHDICLSCRVVRKQYMKVVCPAEVGLQCLESDRNGCDKAFQLWLLICSGTSHHAFLPQVPLCSSFLSTFRVLHPFCQCQRLCAFCLGSYSRHHRLAGDKPHFCLNFSLMLWTQIPSFLPYNCPQIKARTAQFLPLLIYHLLFVWLSWCPYMLPVTSCPFLQTLLKNLL